MEPDHPGTLGLIEMDRNGVANHAPEFVCGVGFGIDRMPERAGLESALGRIRDKEDDLVGHGAVVLGKATTPTTLPGCRQQSAVEQGAAQPREAEALAVDTSNGSAELHRRQERSRLSSACSGKFQSAREVC